jgi:hypothetical protein
MRKNIWEVEMSEHIVLEGPKAIGEWIDDNAKQHRQNHPAQRLTLHNLKEYQEEDKITQDADGKVYYGIRHTIYTPDGWPLVTLQRIYLARNAEEALEKYIFGPTRHRVGHREDCIDVTLRTNLMDRYQTIRAFKLWEGTDHFL